MCYRFISCFFLKKNMLYFNSMVRLIRYFVIVIVVVVQGYDRLLITTWGHDPAVVPASNVLFSLNDALTHSPVLVQVTQLIG